MFHIMARRKKSRDPWKRKIIGTLLAVLVSSFLYGGGMHIKLPEPKLSGGQSIEETLLKRRSVRIFSDAPIDIRDAAQLLWAGQGTTLGGRYRTAPSAGALFPLEIFLVAGNITGLRPGIYRYLPGSHGLEQVLEGDERNGLCEASLGQDPVRLAPAVIVIASAYERNAKKYRGRGIRYADMEAGHSAQNICLQAVSLDLGTVVIGAFDDDRVKKIVKMKTGELPLYVIPVGRPKQ
ncbi:MAG: SagB/ThcOx family dehydrogenase [Spirochaetes bacterium]|nr:SagB/ThcOx family dehydrogenase [Spirochaetota bacterium]